MTEAFAAGSCRLQMHMISQSRYNAELHVMSIFVSFSLLSLALR